MLAHRRNKAFGSNCHVDDSYIESKYTVYKASSTNPRQRERRQPPPCAVTYATKGVERLNFDDPMKSPKISVRGFGIDRFCQTPNKLYNNLINIV